MRLNRLLLWNLAVGAMDSATGLVLIFAPVWTLERMGIAPPPGPALPFLSWMGVFVLAVGLSYFLAGPPPRSTAQASRWTVIWQFTALARTLVALFVAWKVLDGTLAARWITVALTDAVVAAVQGLGLARGWIRPSPAESAR